MSEQPNPVMERILARRPPKARALILAELDEDQSDSMTDYFSHTTKRVVAIGWRTGKREDFRQLRRAAENFEPTRHLGPGKDRFRVYAYEAKKDPNQWVSRRALHSEDYREAEFETETEARAAAEAAMAADKNAEAAMEPGHGRAVEFGYFARTFGYELAKSSVEHRDNYSMGSGNYLKANTTHCSGWRVRSFPLNEDGTPAWSSWKLDNVEDAIPGPGVPATSSTASPSAPDVPTCTPNPMGTAGGAWIVVESKNKRGPFYLVHGPRVERDEFERLRDEARKLDGWYSRAWGGTPGGFGFERRATAELFVAAIGAASMVGWGKERSAAQ